MVCDRYKTIFRVFCKIKMTKLTVVKHLFEFYTCNQCTHRSRWTGSKVFKVNLSLDLYIFIFTDLKMFYVEDELIEPGFSEYIV